MFQKKLKEEKLIEDLKKHGLIDSKKYAEYKKKFWVFHIIQKIKINYRKYMNMWIWIIYHLINNLPKFNFKINNNALINRKIKRYSFL